MLSKVYVQQILRSFAIIFRKIASYSGNGLIDMVTMASIYLQTLSWAFLKLSTLNDLPSTSHSIQFRYKLASESRDAFIN